MHFHAHFLGRLPVRDSVPTAFDHDVGDGFLNFARTLNCFAPRDQRRGNDDGFAANDRPRFAYVHIDIDLALEPQPLDRLLTARAYFIVARTLIYDRRVVVSDVGDVGRLIDDGHVALGRNHGALRARRAELPCFNEAILLRADVVITVRPIVNAGAAIEARFGRERRPADIVVALAPGDPGRRPFVAGTQTQPTLRKRVQRP